MACPDHVYFVSQTILIINCTSLTHRLWLDEFLNMWHSYQNAPTWEAVCTLIPLWIRISVMVLLLLSSLKIPKGWLFLKEVFFIDLNLNTNDIELHDKLSLQRLRFLGWGYNCESKYLAGFSEVICQTGTWHHRVYWLVPSRVHGKSL